MDGLPDRVANGRQNKMAGRLKPFFEKGGPFKAICDSLAPFHRADILVFPLEHWSHQHFNVGGEPIDYKKIRKFVASSKWRPATAERSVK